MMLMLTGKNSIRLLLTYVRMLIGEATVRKQA